MNLKEYIMMELDRIGALDYGAHIDGKLFREICGIEEVKYGTRQDFQKMELQELAISDYVRKQLLRFGKYFKQERDGYRVLLPSENAEQVRSYMRSATKKLDRALLLDTNTPTDAQITSTEKVRAVMKRESIRDKMANA